MRDDQHGHPSLVELLAGPFAGAVANIEVRELGFERRWASNPWAGGVQRTLTVQLRDGRKARVELRDRLEPGYEYRFWAVEGSDDELTLPDPRPTTATSPFEADAEAVENALGALIGPPESDREVPPVSARTIAFLAGRHADAVARIVAEEWGAIDLDEAIEERGSVTRSLGITLVDRRMVEVELWPVGQAYYGFHHRVIHGDGASPLSEEVLPTEHGPFLADAAAVRRALGAATAEAGGEG